eukprot:jgi/Mesvir1/24360/Mv11033-RA.2
MMETDAGAEKKSTARKDLLVSLQKASQEKWEKNKVFEVDAPPTADGAPEKFFGTFPYPYMNGVLHLGHAFSISKLEFAAAYHRLKGDKVLFPFAFHCTGMPIKACADKLAREIQTYGDPPVYPDVDEQEQAAVAAAATPAAPTAEEKDPSKFVGKKSKAAAKKGVGSSQYNIMKMSDIPVNEIASFQDPYHWLSYFPPLAMRDVKAMGCGVDWRRSFITTDMNPYYDSFVRWQLMTLFKQGKVVKDKRMAIFSPLDKQPCADHDRSSGEGVLPQEYTLIKMKALGPFSGKLAALEGRNVFLAAATLRPETMYGQTNCWVLPEGDYGAFEVAADGDVLVVAERAALNLSYQGYAAEVGKPKCLLELKGQDLIGLPLRSPLAVNEVIYTLPMLTILMDKGTGVVTSVPSDAPDDYISLMDLKNKPALCDKFGVKAEWVKPFEVIPIINIPEFGDTSAVKVCEDLKIKSQNDRDKLAEAKKMTYLKGFTEGVMLVGELKGMKVSEAKPIIKKKLIDEGHAIPYSEPERTVISRSGDECVVALTDQWYITYGEEQWKALAEKCLAHMNVYSEDTRHHFEVTLGWLNQWACSRSFGLGTRLPWDEEFLIESLSDSTIYMAYYTVAHYLQGGDMYGKGGSKIQPEQLTNEVWDFIFLDGPMPQTDIPKDLLEAMRAEFAFWYPFDLRVSGKDLIQNHLTFTIYNHTAIFPEARWPRAFRCNGHLLLNSEKMSKNTGNFKTLAQAIEEYSADAVRFALADGGDMLDDANFQEATANAAILKLTKELSWIEEVMSQLDSLRSGDASSFVDRVFANEINIAVRESCRLYESMMFREALKAAFYDLQSARDEYRLACAAQGMHRDLALRFIEVQMRLLAPICPHFCEHVWSNILHKPGFVVNAGLPEAAEPDLGLQDANKYLQNTIGSLRKSIIKIETPGKPRKGSNEPPPPPPKVTGLQLLVVPEFVGWQATCLQILASKFDAKARTFVPDAEIMEAVKASPLAGEKNFKDTLKLCMPFLKLKKAEAEAMGKEVSCRCSGEGCKGNE